MRSTQTQEIVVQTKRPVDRVVVQNAPLVFVGYGVSAPEAGWDDFKGVDLKGKIAVCLINDPDFEAKPGEAPTASSAARPRPITAAGPTSTRRRRAAARSGMLIIHETAPASYGWNTVKNSNSNAQFDIVRENPAAQNPLLQGWIQRDLAKALFKAVGAGPRDRRRSAPAPRRSSPSC